MPPSPSSAALGEPLVKGLTEVAHQRPENPIMFLANFLLDYANAKGGGKLQKNVSLHLTVIKERVLLLRH